MNPYFREFAQRKPPAKRLFSGMAGSRLAQVKGPEAEPSQAPPAATAVAVAEPESLGEAVSLAQPKRRGRPRKYPKGTSDAERMRRVRARNRQARQDAIQEEARQKEIQKVVHGAGLKRGLYMPDAPTGKGELTYSNKIERIGGWAQINKLFGDAEEIDRMPDEVFERKLAEVFANDPALAASFGDFSIDEIQETLRDQAGGRNLEAGRSGKVRPQGASPREEPEDVTDSCPRGASRRGKPEDVADFMIRNHRPKKNSWVEDSEPKTSGWQWVRISEQLQTRIGGILRSLRDDPRFVTRVENEERAHFDGHVHRAALDRLSCALCKDEVELPMDVTLLRRHFIEHHKKELRQLFRAHRCRFNKAILNAI